MNASRFTGLLVAPFCLALATLLFAPSPSTEADVPPNASVTLEVIQCAQGRAEAPQLSIASASEYPNLHYAADSASAQRLGDGYYEVTGSLPQGNYFFQLQSSHCSDYLQAAVLSGHKRILSIALHTRNPGADKVYAKLFDSENAVSGTLAIRPNVGWIVGANGATRVLDLQDGAYYIERVEPGKYSLRFELHGSLQSEIPLDLSDISSKQSYEHDIDAATFRKNIGLILAHGGTLKDCSYCY
jgi:hypothetical protein